jgi:glycosyltransferase involved in cell wall biosynthesis
MRFCIIYDCLYPWTIGGAERWYRNLAERLAAAGHDVTYVTLRQWDDTDAPDLPDVRVVGVGPRMNLYTDGKRRIWPPLRFGLGVFLHLLRRGRHYDRVHMASFPYFSLLAAAAAAPLARYRIAVDWHEVWSRNYWTQYLGSVGGRIGWWVQSLCAKVPQAAYCFSRLHASRLSSLGISGTVTILPGEYAGTASATAQEHGGSPTVVYAGRMIPEKRVMLLVDALAVAMGELPSLRAVLFGRGPEHDRVKTRVAELGLGDRVSLPGFAPETEVDAAMSQAVAIVQPSAREGYGMVAVEASARGVPVVLVAGEDNAATELVDEGRNGFVAPVADARVLADAILACVHGGLQLRQSTKTWYAENQRRLSIEHSIELVLADAAG